MSQKDKDDEPHRTPKSGGSERPAFESTPSPASTGWGPAGDDGDELVDSRTADFEIRGRVTIDFSGPPLELPCDLPEDSPSLADHEEEPEGGGLELDLSELKGKSDAWALDRRHRSSPPPFLASRAEAHPSVMPPPVDPRRLSGRTNPNFPAAPPEVPPPSIGDSTEGDALGLVDRSRPSNQDLDIASDVAERYALGDFTGALRGAELLLGMVPDHPEAASYARSSRERLEQLFASRLGSLARVPKVALPDHEIRWLGLDHRAGFLLSRVDGSHTVEELLDVSGMPRLEALKTLSELVNMGVVRLDDRR